MKVENESREKFGSDYFKYGVDKHTIEYLNTCRSRIFEYLPDTWQLFSDNIMPEQIIYARNIYQFSDWQSIPHWYYITLPFG